MSHLTFASGQSRDSVEVQRYIHRALEDRGKGNYLEALSTLDSAMSITQKSRYTEGELRVLIQTSIIRHILNDYDIALELLFKAERISEQRQDKQSLAEVNNNIGAIYHTQREFMKAADYYNRSIDIYLELQEQAAIGRAYNNFGVLWQDKKEPLTAIEYHRKSLGIWRKLDDEGWIGVAHMHIGVCHKLLGNVDSAITYLEKSAETIDSREDRRILSLVYAELGNAFMQAKRYNEAVKWCQRGFDLSTEMGIVNYQHKNCKCLFEAYEAFGDQSNALKYHKLFTAYRDSAHNEQKLKEMTRIEMDHAFAQKQFADSIRRNQQQVLLELKHQEELANERADRNIAMGVGIGILLVAGGLWNRLQYVRKARRAIQQEKDRAENLLLNILPAEVAAELQRDGKAKAKRYDRVSILFTDFEQFTATAAVLPADELVAEINACFTRFDKICEKHGIEKIKTIGDAYMAVCGLPVPDPKNAQKTVSAALEMQQFIEARFQERSEHGEPAFRMRAGIHTGPVVAGVVGVNKFQFDIWGDAVNTASRMESSGEVGRVNISQTTYDLVKDDTDFSFSSRGRVEAKGKGELEMYFADHLARKQ